MNESKYVEMQSILQDIHDYYNSEGKYARYKYERGYYRMVMDKKNWDEIMKRIDKILEAE